VADLLGALLRQIINALVCATALSTAGASGVLAQPAPPAPVFNWTGLYAGINGGFGGGVLKPTLDSSSGYDSASHFPGTTDTDAQTHGLGGFTAGGQAGYNYQFRNNVVLGVESDFQWSDIRASNRRNAAVSLNADTPFPINWLTSTETAVRQNWFGTTRLRAGYLFTDRFLGYVTGGVAYSEFTASSWGIGTTLTPPVTVFSNTSGAATSTRIGWAAGAGFEYAVGNNFSLKTEYLYSQYAGFAAPYLNTALSVPITTSGTLSTGPLGIHLVRAGLNYKLGGPGDAPDVSRVNAAPASFRWNGFYAGVNGGYGGGVARPTLSELSVEQLLFGPTMTNGYNTDEKLRASGFAAGGQIGYNRQLANRFLIGVETDLQWSGIKASSRSNSSGAYNAPATLVYSANASTTVGQDWFGTTRLRLGYQVSDRLLAYATAGAAYSGLTADYSGASSDNAGGSSITAASGSRGTTRVGWTAGAGVEHAIADNLSFKTEYLYSEYAGFSLPYQTTATTSFSSTATQGTLATGTLGIHLVRAGLNWKLGGADR